MQPQNQLHNCRQDVLGDRAFRESPLSSCTILVTELKIKKLFEFLIPTQITVGGCLWVSPPIFYIQLHKYTMQSFKEYCQSRNLDEGLWIGNDNLAKTGLSKLDPFRRPKAIKPIKPIRPRVATPKPAIQSPVLNAGRVPKTTLRLGSPNDRTNTARPPNQF